MPFSVGTKGCVAESKAMGTEWYSQRSGEDKGHKTGVYSRPKQYSGEGMVSYDTERVWLDIIQEI